MQIGEFPGLSLRKPKIRSIKNPLDKSTIVSIMPKEVDEVKHTIHPGRFIIHAGNFEHPATLVVGPSSWYREFPDDQPTLEIPVSSVEVADAIIRDYCNGLLACDMDGAVPGMFFVPGEVSVVEIKLKYKEKLNEAKLKQDNWFRNLVNLADSLWARSNGNPLTIAEEMRIAARMLNYSNKEWLKDFQVDELVRCAGCGALRNPKYPICASCKMVDQSHPTAKEIKFAS